MKTLSRCIAVILMLSLFGLPTAVSAEEKSLKAMIPWDGEGRVFQVAPDTLLFLGAFEGIIYVETAEGKLYEGFVRCPVTQKIMIETKKTNGSGYCMITTSSDDTVYAEWSCEGQVGGCKGEFKLTGGTGQFEGITGKSKLIVRSPLQVLAPGMSAGNVLRAGSGLAVLPELKYEIPSEKD